MFIRVKKIGNYEYLYLVENAREGGRHVQRVVKALGRRDEVEASGVLDALAASAAWAFATVNCAVELLSRRARRIAAGQHWPRSRCSAGCGGRPAAAMSSTSCWLVAASASMSSDRSISPFCIV